MKKFDGNMIIFDLRQTYHEMGTYAFKIVLNPKIFKSSHESKIKLIDPDHNEVNLNVEKWGRKINCSFDIDESISNGVCLLEMGFISDKNKKINECLSFWVIK